MHTREQLKQIFSDSIQSHPSAFIRHVKSVYGESIIDELVAMTPEVDASKQLKTRVYWLINDLQSYPHCQNDACNRLLDDKDIKNIFYGFPHHCCMKCAKESAVRKQKYQHACEQKYGVGIVNASQAAEVKRKKEQTLLEHFGVVNPMQVPQVKEQVAHTNLERYGAVCPMENAQIRHKAEKTCIERYGVASYSSTDEFVQKMKQTNHERFGVDFPNQDPSIRRAAQRRYRCNGVQFDSKAEIALWLYCVDHSIPIDHSPDVAFPYVDQNGEQRAYHPDFIVDGQLVEIKGLHFFKDRDPTKEMVDPYDSGYDATYEAKRQCMLKNNVLILTDQDCKPFIQYVNASYGKDFLQSCKNIQRKQ